MSAIALTTNQINLIHSRTLRSASGCVFWTGQRNKKGYGLVTLGVNGMRVRMLAHRLIYGLTKGDPDGMNVCHTCDNPSCINPDHLWLGTQLDNIEDMRRKNRARKGESHTKAKLTDQQVHEIRGRYARGDVSHRALAKEYGVGAAQIGRIIRCVSRADMIHEPLLFCDAVPRYEGSSKDFNG